MSEQYDKPKKPDAGAPDSVSVNEARPGKENPPAKEKTPVAVALQYEPGKDDAPRVVAGGRGSIAEQILAIAFAQGVKVREDADLAELLSTIDIDSEIPVEAFAAVAEILIYVYRANGTALPFENGPDSGPGLSPGLAP
ncbi:MAG: EscU/YscU/HrcU family type III secretion system export apparatus switch protein [Rhodospirillales bacterium]